MSRKGILFILSGPSGAGKGTVLNSVFQDLDGMGFSVSATTRAPRAKEIDGKNYFFKTVEEFERMERSGELLESMEKFGNRYGTVKSYVAGLLSAGKDVVLEIDTVGAENLRNNKAVRNEMEMVSIFLTPSNVYELAQRLRGRNTEDADSLERRIRIGFSELKSISSYDYLVINDDLSSAIKEVKSIIIAERCKVTRNAELVARVLESENKK